MYNIRQAVLSCDRSCSSNINFESSHWSRPWWLVWMHVRLVIRQSGVRSRPSPARFFHGDWSWNIFYGHFLLSADSRRAVVSFWWKNVHKSWLTAQRTKPAQEKVWLGKRTVLSMTLMGWLGHKASTQTKSHWNCFWVKIQIQKHIFMEMPYCQDQHHCMHIINGNCMFTVIYLNPCHAE